MIDDKFFKELLQFKSYDIYNKIDCAKFLQKVLSKMGFNVSVIDNFGAPFVYGILECGAKDDILFYSHYDVKPEGDITKWVTPPFDPFYDSINNKIYARGAGDAKGQIYALLKGIYSALTSDKEINYNITVILDGDEESDSPGLINFCEATVTKKYKHIIINDSHWYDDCPVIYMGTRGQATYLINYSLDSIDSNLHAGNYGGLISGAAKAFIHILSDLMRDLDSLVNRKINHDLYSDAISLIFLSSGDTSRSIIPKSAQAKIDVRYTNEKFLFDVESILDRFKQKNKIEYQLVQKSDGFYNMGNPDFLRKLQYFVQNTMQKPLLIEKYCGAYLPMKKLSNIIGTQYIIPIAQSDEHNHVENENISVFNIDYGSRLISEILTNI